MSFPRQRLVVVALLLCVAACKPASPEAATGAAAADAPEAAAPALAVAEPPAPKTSPKDDILASIDKFTALRSYHASMHLRGGAQGETTNEVDFVAPDRFRMETPRGTQVIIGDTMYMRAQGRTMQVPLPAGTLAQWRDPGNIARNAASMTVEAQGSDTVDGTPARKYLVHHTQPTPSDMTMWLGEDGYPLQIRVDGTVNAQASTTTIRYSRINDPTLQIDPPR